MPRFRELKSFKDFQRALKSKYGLGEREDYKPWLRVQDVPSKGSSAKIQGLKINREHHLLSEGESTYFYIAEFHDHVVDIREQFPLLPIDLSIKIASTLGVNHPTIPQSNTLNVMTTDFVLTCHSEKHGTWYEAISVKSNKDDLGDTRSAQKLDIERAWWQLLNVPYQIFVNDDKNKIKSKNIQWFTAPLRQGEIFPEPMISKARDLLNTGPMIISQICSDYSAKFGLDIEQSLSLLKTVFAHKLAEVKLDKLLSEADIVEIVGITESKAIKYVS